MISANILNNQFEKTQNKHEGILYSCGQCEYVGTSHWSHEYLISMLSMCICGKEVEILKET